MQKLVGASVVREGVVASRLHVRRGSVAVLEECCSLLWRRADIERWRWFVLRCCFYTNTVLVFVSVKISSIRGGECQVSWV